MCGIAGVYNLDGQGIDSLMLERMIALQAHRGPDDCGLHLFSLRHGSSVVPLPSQPMPPHNFEGGLAFARLSIRDLSERGHQPMMSDDGKVIIAFNGEIYNALDFVDDLKCAGHIFRGTSDTEVLLRLYLQHGLEGMLTRINGMFAIAIVDLRQRAITLVRDGVGVKPMVWTRVGNSILFASEIKSFLAHPHFKTQLAEENLDEYLAFRYCAGNRHLLKGVYSLRPGRYIRIGFDTELVEQQYYCIPDATRPGEKVGETAAIDGLESSLEKAVKSQLISDVRVGCQLSGGIDSSLVTLYGSKESAGSLEAFSIILNDARLSEETWIDEAARTANVKSHRFTFENNDFFHELDAGIWHLEQPINHPNTLGIKRLARSSQSHVKVLLSGEGADELMGGYNRFYYANIRPRFGPLLKALTYAPAIGERWARNMRPDIRDSIDYFISASMHMPPEHLMQLRPQLNLTTSFELRREIFEEGRGSYLGRCMKYEMQTHMVDLLLRQDRMTMAHSIEGRVPFLDRDLIAFVRSLPDELLVGERIGTAKQRSHSTKMLLKRLARRSFNESFVYRPKSGFTLPLLAYYQDKRFSTLMGDIVLPGMKRRGLFDTKPVEHWWRELKSMPRTLDESYWIPIMFELWAQQWIDRPQSVTTG